MAESSSHRDFEHARNPSQSFNKSDCVTVDSIAECLGKASQDVQTCADLNGISASDEGSCAGYTREQADHLMAVCGLGPTLGP